MMGKKALQLFCVFFSVAGMMAMDMEKGHELLRQKINRIGRS